MSRLTQASLTHRTVALLLSLLVIGLGVYTAGALKQELIPNIDIPRATVVSAYIGATPETVERDVTQPAASTTSRSSWSPPRPPEARTT